MLQKRSESETSFVGVLQATWAGKVEPDEKVEDAIKRECEEELGKDFSDTFIFGKLVFFSEDNFVMKGGDWVCYNYVGEVSDTELVKVKIYGQALPEFVLADKNNFESLNLFEDQKKVLEKILNLDSRESGNDK